MKEKRKKAGRQKKVFFVWLLFACIAILSGLFAGSLAKYVHRETMEQKGNSEQFYFTSDYLTEEGKTYTLSAGTTALTIELRNYADQLRWSDTDISYTYSVNESTGSGTITRTANQGSRSEIKMTDLTVGTYTVTATANSPYTKTLQATFIIPSEDDISFTVSDSSGSPYVLLTVASKTYTGNIEISWPAGVIPDSTQTVFEKVNTWNGSTYDAGSAITQIQKYYSSYTYQFFKTDTAQNYTAEQIKIVKVQ